MGEIQISIESFIGKRDFQVVLNEGEPLIIISENGSGKTTLLTIIAHLLLGSFGDEYKNYVSGKYSRIITKAKINDKLLTAELNDREHFNTIIESITKKSPRLFANFIRRHYDLSRVTEKTINSINNYDYISNINNKKSFENFLLSSEVPRDLIFEYYEYISARNPDKVSLFEDEIEFSQKQSVSNFLLDQNIETIFLPVSRQLELKNRKFSEDNIYGQININSVLTQIINDIRMKSSEANSVIFKNVFSYLSTDSSTDANLKNNDAIRVLNERMASLVSQKTKDNLTSIINEKGSHSNLVKKMLFEINKQLEKEVYPLEKKLSDFMDACNLFFENKKFVYDSNKVQLDLKNTIDDQVIQPSDLSSGELHIVTIFAKIFLLTSNKKKLIIIIDEPELSLSIEWQKKFVNTIMNSKKIFSLILATHSPFIIGYENENGSFQYENNLYSMSDLVIKR